MRIGLIDVDGHNFPNVPLMKISAYHKAQGDTVEWASFFEHYDKVYQSKVFTFTPDVEYFVHADEVQKGGTGYGLDNKLPPCIEKQCPDYSLYPQYSEAYGFLTRGCPRGCPFCIVAEKEGRKSVQVAELSDFYRGQKEIKLLDPNITACADRERLFQQLIDSKAYVDFTQGLDIRFCTEKITDMLSKLRVKRLHFAWDNPREDLSAQFRKFSERYKRKDPSGKIVYVLVNFDSTMEENLYRIYTLAELGYNPYVMVYDKPNAPKEIRRLQRWCNNRIIFGACKRFEDYTG